MYNAFLINFWNVSDEKKTQPRRGTTCDRIRGFCYEYNLVFAQKFALARKWVHWKNSRHKFDPQMPDISLGVHICKYA